MIPPLQPLDATLAVAAQLQPEHVAEIAMQGYRALICNRPDGEVEGQPPASDLAAAAAELGLAFRCIPVVGSAIGEADITAFRAALDQLPGPILAYCRSGNRSSVLWALANASQRPVDELIARGTAAGYDLESWRPRLEQRAAR